MPVWTHDCISSAPATAPGATTAALGIFSHEPRWRHRDAIRSSWMKLVSDDVAAKFVIRGFPALNQTAIDAERAASGDIVFLKAPSGMSREVGPLRSLILWFGCSTRLYPEAAYVGKADDDVFVRAPFLSPILRATRPLLSAGQGVVVGKFESYYWLNNPRNEGPIGFSNNAVRPCLGQTGPFGFPKGAAFFVSAAQARAVAAWARRSGEESALIDGDADRCYRGSAAMRASKILRNQTILGPCAGAQQVPMPYEDVWLGHALSMVASGPSTFVGLDSALFNTWAWGFTARESLVVWHSNADADFPRRSTVLRDWVANETANHCREASFQLRCDHDLGKRVPGANVSCSRTPLNWCRLTSSCSGSVVNMWEYMGIYGLSRRQPRTTPGSSEH